MFEKVKAFFQSLIQTRVIYLFIVFFAFFVILVLKIFNLQIVNGEDYLNNFSLKSKKERTIEAPRGNIYDVNGVLLAYNELAYTVKIEDVYESGSSKNFLLNRTIRKVIEILERNGDTIENDFKIAVDAEDNYYFTVSGTSLLRFKADIYGYAYIDDLKYSQSEATADEMMEYLTGKSRYNVDTENLSKDMILKIVAIRYRMSLNTYQKYITTTIATNISDESVAAIYENSDILDGVTIAEDTIRVYPSGMYTSQIIGYTGRISSEEYSEYSQNDSSYTINDIVGKTGIEKSMESVLRGEKGSETVYVDTLGRVLMSENYKEAIAGNDLYLSIDSSLQESVYHILEQKLAGIILKKLRNTKEFKLDAGQSLSSSTLYIPIYDVYYALFNNAVIDIDHFETTDASENETLAYQAFLNKKNAVFDRLKSELTDKKTVYKKLTTEYQVYENYLEDILLNTNILMSDSINYSDSTYNDWAVNETISLYDYIQYAISKNWIDNDKLSLKGAYSDSGEIYSAIVDILFKKLYADKNFDRILYKYTIKDNLITPKTVCNILIDQNLVSLSDDEKVSWSQNKLSPYQFMYNRISNLEITPAQLALDPYSASCVITDVNNGKVLAIVSYPSYDNNYLANGADAEYLSKILNDKSLPMLNYATQQRTAPGSTYKMVTAAAGLTEGVITPKTLITCTGSFEVVNDIHTCWIYPGRHNALNVTNALMHSCNCFFYEVAYRLSLSENKRYDSDLGIEKLTKYADMFGLTDKSGVEIEEYSPIVSTAYSVPSAIGQGSNSFTTVGIARYVTAVANSGTVYDLTLLDKLCDSNGLVLKYYDANVRNTIELSDSTWDVIHSGMRKVVESKSYFKNFKLAFAGKTGSAQQAKNKADHGLFVCYAPYENPEISISLRIANGYTSEYVADTTLDILKLYFDIEDEEDIVTGNAASINVTTISGD